MVGAVPSARFGRGFFSSIRETDSTGAFLGAAGFSASAAAAAAAAAAARERAAGVGAIAMLRAVFSAGAAGSTLAGLALMLDGREGTEADFADLPDWDLRAVVLLFVLVGMLI